MMWSTFQVPHWPWALYGLDLSMSPGHVRVPPHLNKKVLCAAVSTSERGLFVLLLKWYSNNLKEKFFERRNLPAVLLFWNNYPHWLNEIKMSALCWWLLPRSNTQMTVHAQYPSVCLVHTSPLTNPTDRWVNGSVLQKGELRQGS